MTFKKIYADEKTLFEDAETDALYQRFGGGLSWPGASPGFICIVGEKYGNPGELPPLRVLHEVYHEGDLDGMARLCATLQDLYYLDHWMADCEGKNEFYRQLFYDWEYSQKEKNSRTRVSFCLYQPSIPPDFYIAIQVLRRRFRQNTLILPEDGILVSKLMQADQEDSGQTGLDCKYPEIMTLAAVVNYFDQNPPVKKRPPVPGPPTALAV